MAKKRNGPPRSADSVLGVPSLELVLGVLDRIPGTHASVVAQLLREGRFREATELRLDPKAFETADEFRLALLSYSLIRKYPGLPGSDRKRDDAILKWRACEEQCRVTNERFKEFRIGLARPDLAESFRLARSKIQHLLGPFRWSKLFKFFAFGPGSTTRLPFVKRHLPFKYGESPETTLDNLASSYAILRMSPVWCNSSGGRSIDDPVPCFKIREQSKVTTVPKDAFIDRVIAIEPDMNMYVQKGFGGFLRSRLKRVGVDLDDQSLNQLLARSASLGSLATLDLSSASDTVAYELVRELMPVDWFEALLSCRAHASVLPSGEITNLQKFSSMGNGYTFELESLIFWALCSSVCSETVGREGLRAAVYGDDIVVTVKDYEAVVDILEFSGFTVNPKKSYASGPYRESCGKHYFYGRDVTPVTITKEIRNVSQLLLLCNNLSRWAFRAGGFLYRDSSVFEAHRYCVGHLPHHLRRPKLPDCVGDGALIGTFDEVCPRRCRHGWDGWRIPGVLLPKRKNWVSSGVATLAASLSRLEGQERPVLGEGWACHPLEAVGRSILREMYPRGGGGRISPVYRGPYFSILPNRFASADYERLAPVSLVPIEPGSAKIGKMFITQWCDIGPWV